MSGRVAVRRAGAALAVLLVGVLAGCGVATSGSADRAPADKVPFELLNPDRDASRSLVPGSRTAEIFLFDSSTNRLQPVLVSVPNTDLETVLFQLQAVPAASGDVPSGNPLGDADVILSAELARGVVTVDLSESFKEISPQNQLAALAEIVWTATAPRGLGQVAFTLEGEPIGVPTGDGSLLERAVTRSDYDQQRPADGAA